MTPRSVIPATQKLSVLKNKMRNDPPPFTQGAPNCVAVVGKLVLREFRGCQLPTICR